MEKVVWTGLESSGKSLQLSRTAELVRIRNAKWYALTGKKRIMAFTSPMSAFWVDIVNETSEYRYTPKIADFINLTQMDFFCDEIIKYFPAQGSTPLTSEQMTFIGQGAKAGISVYATTVDFSQVHKQFRLFTQTVFVVSKIMGSSRPIETAPPVGHIWGLCMKRQVLPSSFKGDSVTMETIGWPSPFFIHKADTDRYDTSFRVQLSTLPVTKVRKQVFVCEEDGHTFHKYI